MQPVHVEPVGNFTQAHRLFDKNQLPRQLAFNSAGSIVCLYTSQWLECYSGTDKWIKLFSWSPSTDRCLNDAYGDVRDWLVASVCFFDNAYVRDLPSTSTALCVLLNNQPQDCSVVCYFPDVTKCARAVLISLRGLLNTCEWVPPPCSLVQAVDPPPVDRDRSTLFLETLDISNIEAKRNSSEKQVAEQFSGCLAVGFQQGYLGLLDMCLSWPRDGDSSGQVELAVAMEKTQLLQLVRNNQRISFDASSMEHTIVYFDASVVRWNEFQYKSVSGKVLRAVPAASVYVSTLRYIPNTQTLAVGFSFGGWQLWSLSAMCLEFSLRQLPSPAAVASITFQEPSDDPRFCCYLWVGWQSRIMDKVDEDSTQPEDPKSVYNNAQAKLYQLFYRHRHEDPTSVPGDPTYRYQELIGLSERLSTLLFTSNKIPDPFPDQLLNIQPIRTAHNEGNSGPYAAHLVALIWRINASTIRIGLFDLDRWYHAQLPTYIRSDNSFFAVFDASVPRDGVTLLNGQLLSSSLASFWSKIASRERQLTSVWEPTGTVNNTRHPSHHSLYGATMANPVPEVCLRPSALSFDFLVGWCLQPDKSGPGGLALVQFTSRQEACLMLLSKHLSSTSATGPSQGRFEINDWLSEAWVTGLLEAPGLDPLDDEDLERLLRLSNELTDLSEYRKQRSTEAARVGFRLTYGDDLDADMLQELDILLRNESISTDAATGRPAKRQKTLSSSNAPSSSHADPSSSISLPSTVVLSPAWVLLANCLLEHGHLVGLKSLDQLAAGCGPCTPCSPQFRRVWLWLRFRRLKARFDRQTVPLFAAQTNNLSGSFSVVDFTELGFTSGQLQHLSSVAQYWFGNNQAVEIGAEDTAQSTPFWKVIQTFAAYTRLVAFLCRMGLLPQSQNTTMDLVRLVNHAGSGAPEPLLSPYHHQLFVHLLNHLYARSHPSVDEDAEELDEQLLHRPTLSDAVLDTAVTGLIATDSTDSPVSDYRSVWWEQEEASSSGPWLGENLQPSYPPKRLQSVCALWQLPSNPTVLKARLGLLGFLLCDATAAVALVHETAPRSTGDRNQTSRMLALKLCQHVMSLFAKEFPTCRPLLPTIFALWLIDRGFFKESLSIQLISFVTSVKLGSHCRTPKLVQIFPNQTAVLERYLKSSGHVDVFRRLTQLFRLPPAQEMISSNPQRCDLVADFQATGAPFLALSRLRRALCKMQAIHMDDPIPNDITEKAERMAREAFIHVAEACRHAGRLGDLVNLGLSSSEAQILVDHYWHSGHYDILFHCLLARKQYSNALSVFEECRRRGYCDIPSTAPNSQDNTETTLNFISKLLSDSLPAYTDDIGPQEGDKPSKIARALTCLFSDSTGERETTVPNMYTVAYRRDSAVTCPLTTKKEETVLERSRKREYSHPDLAGFSSDEESSSPGLFKVNRLLGTAKKSSSEFWETFHELEGIRRSYNLSSTGAKWNDSSFLSQPSVRPSMAKSRQSKNNTDRLFKSIYTPPPQRQRKVQDEPRRRSTLHARRSYRPVLGDTHTPVSILKSPAPPKPPNVSPTANGSATAEEHHLDATLDEVDSDVTLNLSTIRPSCASLTATPLVHTPTPHSSVTSVFTYPAPQRLSMTRLSPNEMEEQEKVIKSEPEFHFAVPLSQPFKKPASPPKPASTVAHEAVLPDTEDNMVITPVRLSHQEEMAPTSLNPPASGPISPIGKTVHQPSETLPPWRFLHTSSNQPDHLKSHPEDKRLDTSSVAGDARLAEDDSMDLDDTASVTSSMSESSMSLETPRRSGRRVRPPKRYDPSIFK
ncbi:hypothetical protein CRM22_000834 [Opisthorchis felineus]|uniref:ELYS beta-propeller domain-containing protein n=1 Tax=Opisthorchis felineus TaxID=147828 RepID=A0A4S2MHN5_OPIFE|nr:hypothetical protein CRM22_000834 [Opisthorchis felineus]